MKQQSCRSYSVYIDPRGWGFSWLGAGLIIRERASQFNSQLLPIKRVRVALWTQQKNNSGTFVVMLEKFSVTVSSCGRCTASELFVFIQRVPIYFCRVPNDLCDPCSADFYTFSGCREHPRLKRQSAGGRSNDECRQSTSKTTADSSLIKLSRRVRVTALYQTSAILFFNKTLKGVILRPYSGS